MKGFFISAVSGLVLFTSGLVKDNEFLTILGSGLLTANAIAMSQLQENQTITYNDNDNPATAQANPQPNRPSTQVIETKSAPIPQGRLSSPSLSQPKPILNKNNQNNRKSTPKPILNKNNKR